MVAECVAGFVEPLNVEHVAFVEHVYMKGKSQYSPRNLANCHLQNFWMPQIGLLAKTHF